MKRIFSLLILMLSLSTKANNCQIENSKKYLAIGNNLILTHQNNELNGQNNQIETAIISLHGTLRNGSEYFSDMCNSLGENLSKTLVISPTFKREDDPRRENELYWGRRWFQKWKYGYVSQNNDHVSSYDVMDELIKKISNPKLYPNLKKIFLIGHSAGGQFVQRYAVATTIAKEISHPLSFIVSNPSSYLYLHEKRLKFENDFIEFTPIKEECTDYNEYIYGLEGELAPYFNQLSTSELIKNFEHNHVIYLMSEEDKETDYLDRSCGANLQGKNRIDRAYHFFQYIRKNYPSHNHEFFSIPQIGHDHLKVFNAEITQKIFFGPHHLEHLIINRIGSVEDKITSPTQSFILQGGGGNEHGGFIELLKNTNGGDVLILSTKSKINHRYTHYLYKLAEKNNIPINSITTISTKSRTGAQSKVALNYLSKADSIFLTGGDQYRYQKYWEHTDLIKKINEKLSQGISIAGSSAGLAILGEYYFSAKNGTIYSEEALRHPNSDKITIERGLIKHSLMNSIITDSHFSERNREGRLLAFMKHILNKKSIDLKGIGVDEMTSMIIKENKITVSGSGRALIYILKNQKFTSLNFGPVKRYSLIKGDYPSLNDLQNNFNLISVVNGEIIQN